MTRNQKSIVKIAQRQLKLDDGRYRMILRNVAGVDSSRQLDNAGLEDVMAFLEGMGFEHVGHAPDYWRQKVRRREGGEVSDRQIRMIERLAGETAYPVAGMCERHSHGRTRFPGKLWAPEAFEVIEAYKAIIKRERPTSVEPAAVGAGDALSDDDIPF